MSASGTLVLVFPSVPYLPFWRANATLIPWFSEKRQVRPPVPEICRTYSRCERPSDARWYSLLIVACYHPLSAYRLGSGDVVFTERGDVIESLSLPCGRCIGCRLERVRQWSCRIVHEAKLYESNSFVTLTYANSPVSLQYRDVQLFLKRLRARFKRARIRFFCSGEYGGQFGRPHYHVILFNFWPPDAVRPTLHSRLYTSTLLDQLWGLGGTSVGAVTPESASYVAGYCIAKMTGDVAVAHYRMTDWETGETVDRLPEFAHMSLRPGIGAGWLDKFKNDVYPAGTVVVKGREAKAPRYYDKKFAALEPEEFEFLKLERLEVARRLCGDSTEERLLVREKVALGAYQSKKGAVK